MGGAKSDGAWHFHANVAIMRLLSAFARLRPITFRFDFDLPLLFALPTTSPPSSQHFYFIFIFYCQQRQNLNCFCHRRKTNSK